MSTIGEIMKEFDTFAQRALKEAQGEILKDSQLKSTATTADLAQGYLHLATMALNARRNLFESGRLQGARQFGPKLFDELRQLGIKWSIEIPIFRWNRKTRKTETLLVHGGGRTDGYKDTFFVLGAQQPERASPEDVLQRIEKKFDLQLAGKVKLIEVHWSYDDAEAPTLNLLMHTTTRIPKKVKGAVWYPMDELPTPIAPNEARMLQIGFDAYKKRTRRTVH